MAVVLGATDFDELVTSTLQNIKKDKLYDQVMLRHPLLAWIRSKERSATGRELVINLVLAEDDSTQWTDDAGTFKTTRSGKLVGAARYDWPDPLVSSVRLNWKETKMNTGKQQVIDLVRTHIKAMVARHRKEIVKSMHALARLDTPTTQGNAEIQPLADSQFFSLDQLISDKDYDADPKGDGSNDNAFDIGKINATTQPLWQSLRKEDPVDTGNDIRKAFRRMFNDLHATNDEGHQIQKVIGGQDIFEEFEDSFYDVAESRQNPDDSKGQTHYVEIRHGNIVLRFDPDCAPKRAYFVDPDTIDIKSLAGVFLQNEPSQAITGTLERVTPVVSVLATLTNQRRANGLLLRPATAGEDA